VHEDVQIWLFYFSLEGIARDWYRSLPIASINSLAEFHAAFHLFCKEIFSANLLFPECCHEFNLLTKDSKNYEEYAVIGDISHCDQDIDELHNNSHSISAFDIVSNASIVLGCQENRIVPFEDLKGDEQIDKSTSESVESAVDAEGSSQFSGLQGLEDLSRYEEEGDELKGSDQQSFLYDSLTEDEQSVFSIETSNGKREQKKLDQQFMMHVSLSDVEHPAWYEFSDPIATHMEMFCSKKILVVAIVEVRFFDCMFDFKDYVSDPTVWLSITLHKVASQLLSWLLWKSVFT
jgi:hypothetical protein